MVYTNTMTNYDEFPKIYFLNERGLLVLEGNDNPWTKTNNPPSREAVIKKSHISSW